MKGRDANKMNLMKKNVKENEELSSSDSDTLEKVINKKYLILF